MPTMKELMEDFQSRYEKAIESHEKLVAESHARYEQTLADATNQFKGMMAEAHASNKAGSAQKEQEPAESPQAVWIKAPTEDGKGENLMVLNQQAVVMFMAIFQRMSEISEELKKLGTRRSR